MSKTKTEVMSINEIIEKYIYIAQEFNEKFNLTEDEYQELLLQYCEWVNGICSNGTMPTLLSIRIRDYIQRKGDRIVKDRKESTDNTVSLIEASEQASSYGLEHSIMVQELMTDLYRRLTNNEVKAFETVIIHSRPCSSVDIHVHVSRKYQIFRSALRKARSPALEAEVLWLNSTKER